ncbi:OmpA family protein [Kineococcus terrestris]|uniref:OmpA family protein n=1 Tax=Kineococcus terrestris TaxID=2044856 RepID=UPI0034DB636A
MRRAAAVLCAGALVVTSAPAAAASPAAVVDVRPDVRDVVATVLDVRPEVVDVAPRTDEGVEIVLGADVLFAFGSADLPPGVDELLAGVVERAAAAPGRIVVAGHTDGIGDDASNQVLSEQRARAVSDYLGQRVPGAQVESTGFGETQPLVPELTPAGDDDPAARAVNRRVTITLEDA